MSSPAADPASRPSPAGPALAALIITRLTVSPSIYPGLGRLEDALLVLLLLGMVIAGRARSLSRPLLAGLLIYFAAPFMLAPFSLQPAGSVETASAMLGNLAFFFAAALCGRRGARYAAAGIIIGASLSAAFALRQRLGGFEATLAVEGISEYARTTLQEARVFGLTFSPDLLAATLAGALPLAGSLLLLGRKAGRLSAWFLPALAAVLFGVVLLLSRSLGGLLAAAFGFLAWALLMPGVGRRARLGMVIGAAGAALIGAAGIILLRGGHLFDFNNWDNPLLLRLDNWRTALRVAGEFPAAGAGAGQYGLAMFLHRSPGGNEAKHVHNLVLETLVDTGPLGVIGLLLVSVSFVVVALRAVRQAAGDGGLLSSAFFAAAAALLFHGLLDFSWQTPEVAVIFWVSAGVLAGEAGRESHWPRLRWVVVAVLLPVLALEGLVGMRVWTREEAVSRARENDWKGVLFVTRDGQAEYDDELSALAGIAALRQGDQAGAVKHLRRAVDLNPRNPFYRRDLALALRDPAERLSLLRRAVELYPNSPDLLAVLGRALLESGDHDEAEKVLQKGAALPRANGDCQTLLGLLYARQGRPEEAERWLKRGAEAFPHDQTRIKVYKEFMSRQGQR